MGAIGETGDGAPGLGKELIQLAKRSLFSHQVLGTAGQRFPHALQHLTSLVLAGDHLIEEIATLPAGALHVLVFTDGGTQFGQLALVLLLFEKHRLPELLILFFKLAVEPHMASGWQRCGQSTSKGSLWLSCLCRCWRIPGRISPANAGYLNLILIPIEATSMTVQKIAGKRQGEVEKRRRRKNADVPALQKMKPNVIKTLGSKKVLRNCDSHRRKLEGVTF